MTGLFDPTIDNESGRKSVGKKRTGLKEMLTEYNELYDQHFDIVVMQNLKRMWQPG